VVQINALRSAGYTGPISYEPFAASVHALADAGPVLRASMQFISTGVTA
jgi:2-keto-myo-inositol isomerase